MGFFESINGFLGQANGALDQVGDALDSFGEITGKLTAGSQTVILPTGGGFAGGGFTGVSPFGGAGASAQPAGLDTGTVVLLAGLAIVVLVLVMK